MAGNRRPSRRPLTPRISGAPPLAAASQTSHPRRPLAAAFQPSHPPTFARAIAVADWYNIAYEQVNVTHRSSRCARSPVRSCKSQEFFILRVLPDVLPYEPEAMTGRVPGVARSRESGDGGSPRPRPGEDHPRAAAPKPGEKNGLLAASRRASRRRRSGRRHRPAEYGGYPLAGWFTSEVAGALRPSRRDGRVFFVSEEK